MNLVSFWHASLLVDNASWNKAGCLRASQFLWRTYNCILTDQNSDYVVLSWCSQIIQKHPETAHSRCLEATLLSLSQGHFYSKLFFHWVWDTRPMPHLIPIQPTFVLASTDRLKEFRWKNCLCLMLVGLWNSLRHPWKYNAWVSLVIIFFLALPIYPETQTTCPYLQRSIGCHSGLNLFTSKAPFYLGQN